MRKILNKYSCVFFFLIGSYVTLVNAQPGNPGGSIVIPPSHYCCEDLAPPDGQESSASPEFLECIGSSNPESYCTVPVDNSIYIYISIVAGVAFASFVIARRMKT